MLADNEAVREASITFAQSGTQRHVPGSKQIKKTELLVDTVVCVSASYPVLFIDSRFCYAVVSGDGRSPPPRWGRRPSFQAAGHASTARKAETNLGSAGLAAKCPLL